MSSTPTHYESGEEIPPGIRAILDMLNKKIESREETNWSLNAQLDSLLTPQNTPGQQSGPDEVTAQSPFATRRQPRKRVGLFPLESV